MTSSTSTYGLGSSNESKLTAHIISLIFMENGFSNKNPSHLQLLIQAYEFIWGNFGSRGLEGQEVCSVKLQQFKVDKRDMLLGVSSPTP